MTTALPAPEDKARTVEAMFDRVAPKYDKLNRALTFGMDRGWRRTTTRMLRLAPQSLVLDVACGTGDFCIELADNGLRPIGLDFSAGMLDHARWSERLLRGDATSLGVRDASLDGMTCGFALRNFTSLEPFFAEAARVVRPGGRVAFLDVGEPKSRLLRFGHGVYFRRVVPMIGGLFSDRAAYRYLPASAAYLPPPDELIAMVRAAGFDDVQRRTFFFGTAQAITATRR